METPPEIGAPSFDAPVETTGAVDDWTGGGVLVGVGVTDTGVTDTGVIDAGTTFSAALGAS